MDHDRAQRTGAARTLAVLAVLVGMFLMHGAPSSASGGCHGGMSAAVPATAHPMAAAQSVAAESAAEHPPRVPREASAAMGPMGGLCLSTGVRDHQLAHVLTLVALAVLLLFLGAVGAGVLRVGVPARRRGPPGGGRQILLRVCIART